MHTAQWGTRPCRFSGYMLALSLELPPHIQEELRKDMERRENMKPKSSINVLLIALLLLGFGSYGTLPLQAAPGWPIPEGLKTIDVNGYEMAYQETGDRSGVPLVLIHGSLNDYRSWTKQIPEFSAFYRTIAVSLRHHYPERWNGAGDDFTITQHASDVSAFIQKLNLGKVHLLGHSRGGPIALMVAQAHPELLRTIILEDANIDSLLPDTPEKQKRAADWTARADITLATLKTGDAGKAAQEWIDSYSGAGAWEKVPPLAKQIVLDNIWTSAKDRGDRGTINCGDIQKLGCPILLLTGERSPKLFGEIITAVRHCKPDIQAPVIIPQGTHSMHVSNPSFFNQAVLDFLNRN